MWVWISLGFLIDVYEQGSGDNRWFRESCRKLFFDFYTQRSVENVANGFDAEKWADELITHIAANWS
jgi:hypothetical protein